VASACPDARTCHLVKKESVANAVMPCHSAKKANAPVKIANTKSCECCIQNEIQRNIKQSYEFRPGLSVIQTSLLPSLDFQKVFSARPIQKPKLLLTRNRIFLDKAALLL
jgi:hypothetical protein